MSAQDAAETLLEKATTVGLGMGTTWEEDARKCEVKQLKYEYGYWALVVSDDYS